MKLAYLLPEKINPDGTSGAAAHIRENIKSLQGLGHEVLLVSHKVRNRSADSTHLKNNKGSIWRTVFNWVPQELKWAIRGVRTRHESAVLLRQHRSEIAQCDVIYERDAYQSFATHDYAEALDIPWILECNGVFWDDEDPFHRPLFPRLYKRRHVRKWKKADHLIAVSQSFKAHMVAEGIDPEKITVIHNGVDLTPYQGITDRQVEVLREKLGVRGGTIVVGFLGHMLPWHRIDLFLNGIKRLSDDECNSITILLIGGGRWREYRQEAYNLGIAERVIFTGPVDPADVPLAVAAMDICTVPGICEPGSPVKLFDYGAGARPVLAADFPSVKEIITDEETGLLFQNGSVDDFVSKLKRLIEDRELRQRLGKSLHGQVSRDHTWQRVGERTEKVLEMVRQSFIA